MSKLWKNKKVPSVLTAAVLLIAIAWAVNEVIPFTNLLIDTHALERDLQLKSSDVRTFESLWTLQEHSFSYLDGRKGEPRWTARSPLYGRYVVSISIPVTMNWRRSSIESVGHPEVVIRELQAVNIQDGRVSTISGNLQRQLTDEEWRNVQEHMGSFEAIGIKLHANSPVANFERGWKQF